MSNLPQSDWILAGRFVDGDLSATEAAAAKSRIDSDEDFAAAVEEIRAQSNLFGRLPNFEPSEDLEDRTLQASLDQVKAIMGAWPIESSEGSVTLSKHESADSFDWKSTAALAASLAGIFLIGAMLWQTMPGGSNLAMERAGAPAPSSQVMGKAADLDSVVAEDQNQLVANDAVEVENELATPIVTKSAPSLPGELAEKSSVANTGAAQTRSSMKQLPEIGPLFGTPAKRSKLAQTAKPAPQQPVQEFAVNASAPVEQIWCVSQDRTASKDSVCEILNFNQIQVQREEQPEPGFSNPSPFEAFYVAATPKQMKLAMSQISNNANIEMIQLPSSANSPIADAIAQQFVETESAPTAPTQQANTINVPPGFKEPASQALAQQLVSNALPRNFVPSGPVPPILKSGTPIDGLESEADEETEVDDASQQARSQMAAKQVNPAPAGRSLPPSAEIAKGGAGGAGAGAGGGGFGGGLKPVDPPANNVAAEQPVLSLPQQAELDKYLDDSDQRLRQYLILVRGGEGE